MCYYLTFNNLCGITQQKCGYLAPLFRESSKCACPDYRTWMARIGLGSYLVPPMPNLSPPEPPPPKLNDWELECPF